MSAHVALATCAAFPQLADDEPLLLDQLRARGVGAEPVVWDDHGADWGAYELVVVRTTWDYSWRREAFLGWIESLPRVLNAAEVIRWNTDKRYLAEVPHAVPTEFVSPGDPWEPPAGDFVVKPTVASGSRDAARYRTAESASARPHVERLLDEGRSVMVQPYLDAVEGHGETALIFLAGPLLPRDPQGPDPRPRPGPRQRSVCRGGGQPARAQRGGSPVADEILDSLPWPRPTCSTRASI